MVELDLPGDEETVAKLDFCLAIWIEIS